MPRKRLPRPCDNEECRAITPNGCSVNVRLHMCQACARRLMLETATLLVIVRDYARPDEVRRESVP